MKFIIDVDGTLLNGEKANIDAVAFIQALSDANYPFVLMTNSIKAPELVSRRLANVGINVACEKIFNPISSMNTYIHSKAYEKAYVMGSTKEIEQLAINVVNSDPDVVLLLDFEKENYSYRDLQKLVDFATKGIPFITASRSTHYVREGRKFIDTGSFVELIETITGIEILVMGKPSLAYFQAGLEVLQADAEGVTVVGDDWQTDIKGGLAASCKVVLLQSGKYQEGDELRLEGVSSVNRLMDILLV